MDGVRCEKSIMKENVVCRDIWRRLVNSNVTWMLNEIGIFKISFTVLGQIAVPFSSFLRALNGSSWLSTDKP